MDATTTKGETKMEIRNTYQKAYSLATILEELKAGRTPSIDELVKSAVELIVANQKAEIVPGRTLSIVLDVAELLCIGDREALRGWLFDSQLTKSKLDVGIAAELNPYTL